MITDIETGLDQYRRKKGYKPYYVSWRDNANKYLAYFPFLFLATAFADKMKSEIEKQTS
jgi:hypothetical protein